MAKYHWTNSETAIFGEYFLEHLLEEARFAIYGDGVDLVDPDGAWRRLYDWWTSIPYEKRPPQLSDYNVRWGEVADAVIRGVGQPRRYFSDFVSDGEVQRTIYMNRDVLAEVTGAPGSRYSGDRLTVSFVTGYVGDAPLDTYTFEVPEQSTVAILDDYSLPGEWFDHMLGILALMGFSIVRIFQKLPGNGGRVFSHHGKYVTTWWLRGEPDDDWDAYNGDRHPEIRILGSRIMTGHDSGFMYTGDDDWGNTWAYVYQSSYDNTESQINVDEFVKALNEVNPDGDDWRCGSVSGAGKPTPYLVTARMYDDNGQITAAYAKCAELLHDIESEGCLNYDEFYKQEGDYTAECIQRVIEGLDDYDEEDGRGLLPGHPEIEKIVQSVWNELSENNWSTGNLDDFVLEDEQVLTALRNLNLIDATKYDEWEFCPIDYHGWSKWTSQRFERRNRKPERVFPKAWVGEAHPLLEWTARDMEGLKFEVVWSVGGTEGLAVTTEQSYRLTEPLPLHLGEDVVFSWKVRAILPNGIPTEWVQGWTYNMFQARTGKQSPDAA